MRISQLAERADVPVATVKYYLRVGLLPPGELTSATQATYDDGHVERLRLVRALIEVAGLSHVQVQAVLGVVDGDVDLFDALGTVHDALPPGVDDRSTQGRAAAVVDGLGWWAVPGCTAMRQLDQALDAAADAGLPVDEAYVGTYAEAALAVAEQEIAHMPRESREAALTYTAVGTVLYEPVLLALRRLAEAHVAHTETGGG